MAILECHIYSLSPINHSAKVFGGVCPQVVLSVRRRDFFDLKGDFVVHPAGLRSLND
jgi:hypothetical protein